jgi:hypothetical protein
MHVTTLTEALEAYTDVGKVLLPYLDWTSKESSTIKGDNYTIDEYRKAWETLSDALMIPIRKSVCKEVVEECEQPLTVPFLIRRAFLEERSKWVTLTSYHYCKVFWISHCLSRIRTLLNMGSYVLLASNGAAFGNLNIPGLGQAGNGTISMLPMLLAPHVPAAWFHTFNLGSIQSLHETQH